MYPVKFLFGFKNYSYCLNAAYSVFTHGLITKWLFIAQTIPDVDDVFEPLEDCIQHTFIPAVTGHSPPGDLETDLFALPTGIGGMGIISPIKMCTFEFLPLINL